MRIIAIFGFTLTTILSSTSLAQEWEVGVLGGGSFQRNARITNPSGSAQAGFDPGFTFGAVFGQNMYRYVSGEIRYMFIAGAPLLEFGPTEASTGGHTNLVHYDVVIHVAPNETKFRPYFAVGGGVKVYTGHTDEFIAQPLLNFAVLRHVNETEPMLSVGAGVKYLPRKNVQLRFDFHTYMTPAPDDLFEPTFRSRLHGWIYSFVPMVGVSYVF